MRSIRLSFTFLLLAAGMAFGADCNSVGYPCMDMNTQIKGSRLPSWGVDSGAANVYAITTVAPIGSGGVLKTGSLFMFVAIHANTSASTLAVDGGSAIAIKKNVSTALASGDIPLNGVTEVVYDGTNFQCLTCGSSSSGYSTIDSNGSAVTQRATVNFIPGTNVTLSCVDNPGASRTDCTVNATNSAGGGTIGGASYGGTYCTRSTTGSATSQNCASNYNVEANQLIIATAGFFAGNCTGTPAFADTLAGGLTWHQIGTACNATNHQMETAWWATPGASTGADTFTVSCSGCNDGNGAGNFSFMGMTISESIGASLSSPIDASTTVTGAGLQSFDLTGYSSTADLTFLAFQNSGASGVDANMFTILNDTVEANAVQHGQLGPYHMRPNLGSNGAGVAFAIH